MLKLIELNSQRRTLKEDIIYAGLRRHKVHFIDAIGRRRGPVALLPDARREKRQHAQVLQIRSRFAGDCIQHAETQIEILAGISDGDRAQRVDPDGNLFLFRELRIFSDLDVKAIEDTRRVKQEGHVVAAVSIEPDCGCINAGRSFPQPSIQNQHGRRIAAVILKTSHRGGHAFHVVIDHLVGGVGHQHGPVFRRPDDGIGSGKMPGQSGRLLSRGEAGHAGISALLAKVRQTNHRYKLIAGRSHIRKIPGEGNLVRRFSNRHGVEQCVGGRIEDIDNVGRRIYHETEATVGSKSNGSQARAGFDPSQNLMPLRIHDDDITVTFVDHIDRFAERRGRQRRGQRSDLQYFDPS